MIEQLQTDAEQTGLAFRERDLGRPGEIPESISARRVVSGGTPAAFATASAIKPASATCLSSPVKSRRTKSPSASPARPKSASSSSLRFDAEPLPVVDLISVITLSRSPTVRLGPGAAARSTP